eukprot:scaffold2655_cov179-Amphora_coffeaeformis.AAC.12
MYSTRVLSARSLAVVPLRRNKRTLATATAVVAAKTSRVPVHVWVWTKYQTNLDKRPLLTKAVMASFIFFASDSVTQCVLPGKNNFLNSEAPGGDHVWRWDGARALSGAGFGVVATSWLHFWWGFLETQVGRAVPAQRSRLANTMVKVAIDQLLGSKSACPAISAGEQRKGVGNAMAYNDATLEIVAHCALVQLLFCAHSSSGPGTGWSGYLSHLNHADTKIITPDEEIKITIVRRETETHMKEQQTQRQK